MISTPCDCLDRVLDYETPYLLQEPIHFNGWELSLPSFRCCLHLVRIKNTFILKSPFGYCGRVGGYSFSPNTRILFQPEPKKWLLLVKLVTRQKLRPILIFAWFFHYNYNAKYPVLPAFSLSIPGVSPVDADGPAIVGSSCTVSIPFDGWLQL